MAMVRISLHDGTDSLNALGNIYRRPFEPTSVPVMKNVAIRHVAPWGGDLPKGKYEYRYQLQNGEGEYELEKFENDEQIPSNSSGKRDGLMQVGNIFRFEVGGDP